MFLHIDIDCFFASAHRSVDPSLKGIPIAVGSRSNLEIFDRARNHTKLIQDNSGAFVTPVFHNRNRRDFESYFVDKIDGRRKIRGIVTTASYEARAKGVKTAMAISQALQLCPNMLVIPSNYPLYHKLSHQIHEYVSSQIALVEQYSIDEFFCDVSGWIDDSEVYGFATRLQQSLVDKFDIPVSIGISRAKWIAKLATESAKPYGVYEVKDIDSYIEEMPIAKFPGIGKAIQKRLGDRYIKTLGEIRREKELLYSWGKIGVQLYGRITGELVEQIEPKGERKSIGISRTFDPIDSSDEIRRRIMIMARHIAYITLSTDANPTSYYLKINYLYGEKAKMTLTVDRLFSEKLLKTTMAQMYDEIAHHNQSAIKLTISVSNFNHINHKTLSLIDMSDDIVEHKMSIEIQELRDKFGLDIIKNANEL